MRSLKGDIGGKYHLSSMLCHCHLLHFFSTKSFNKTLFFGRFILLVCSKYIEKYDTTDQVTAVAGRVLESASIFSIFGNFLKIIRSGYYKSFE